MKKTIYAAFVFAALGMTACKGGEDTKEGEKEAKEEKVEAVEYTVDTEESKLNWTGTWIVPTDDGEMKEVKSHDGFVKFSEGNLTKKEDEVSGTFKIDMTTIENTDLEEKSENLETHLKGTREDDKGAFFNTPKYPTVKVELKSINEGNANIVIHVLGKELEETVPVTTKTEGDKMMMTGDFSVDFTPVDLTMTKPNPEKPEEGHIDPNVDFSLQLVMKKK